MIKLTVYQYVIKFECKRSKACRVSAFKSLNILGVLQCESIDLYTCVCTHANGVIIIYFGSWFVDMKYSTF